MASQKLLLFGGTGFVGSRILQKALQRGWKVICASRGGLPSVGSPILDQIVMHHHHPERHVDNNNNNNNSDNNGGDAFTRDVSMFESPLEFVSLDATSRSQVMQLLADHADTTAVVSCIGRMTCDHVEARRLCGDANVNIAAAVYERGRSVRRVVLLSASTPPLPRRVYMPLFKGYYHGRKIAERAVLENLSGRGVVLRPGFIFGNRYIHVGEGFIPLPLQVIGRPVEAVLRCIDKEGTMQLPIDVDIVAEATVRTIDMNVAGGVLDYHGMQEICAAGEQGKEKET